MPFEEGESAALARVRYYVWESERMATYFEMRNDMLGGDYSSKLAPWLAHGCVSPRHVNAEVRKFPGRKGWCWVVVFARNPRFSSERDFLATLNKQIQKRKKKNPSFLIFLYPRYVYFDFFYHNDESLHIYLYIL